MRLPVIQGVIRRRILVNFRVDPGLMQAQLPPRFRPKLHQGHSIANLPNPTRIGPPEIRSTTARPLK